MNLVLWYEGSSAAIPFFTLVALLALWFCVSVPLTFVGAFFGFRKRAIEHPVRTNQIPRQIPEQSIYTQVRKISNKTKTKTNLNYILQQTNFL
jgi:transmembrane 9 superfamily protein 2/4